MSPHHNKRETKETKTEQIIDNVKSLILSNERCHKPCLFTVNVALLISPNRSGTLVTIICN